MCGYKYEDIWSAAKDMGSFNITTLNNATYKLNPLYCKDMTQAGFNIARVVNIFLNNFEGQVLFTA